MKNVTKLTVSAIALCGGAFVAAPAMAQAPTVSGNVTIVSDYRFRGVTLSDNAPALQAGMDLGWESGFYIGAWGSTIETLTSSNDWELDLYAGYGGDLGASGMSYDLGVLLYTYPGYEPSFEDSIIPEIYASLGGEAGAAAWSVGAAYAFDAESTTEDNIYIFGDVEFGLGDSPVSLLAHVGYEDGAFGTEKFDWALGLGASAIGLDFGLSYVGFDQSGGDDDAIVASIGTSW